MSEGSNMAQKSEASQKFSQSLRGKLGMAPPPQEELAAKLQESWTPLEESVAGIKEASDVLAEASKGDPIVERAVGDGIMQLAQGLEGVVAAIEGVEALLVDAGLVEDDQLLEPASPAA